MSPLPPAPRRRLQSVNETEVAALAERLTLNVNGRTVVVEADPDAPLLYILRNDLELNGPKFGCGLVQCGACTVLLDGQPARSCRLPVSRAVGRDITTLEGLGTYDRPHPIQQAFIAEQAAQCGYCMNGMMLAAKALLDANPDPTEDDIRRALDGYLCRCGTHLRIIRAIRRAARELAGRTDAGAVHARQPREQEVARR